MAGTGDAGPPPTEPTLSLSTAAAVAASAAAEAARIAAEAARKAAAKAAAEAAAKAAAKAAAEAAAKVAAKTAPKLIKDELSSGRGTALRLRGLSASGGSLKAEQVESVSKRFSLSELMVAKKKGGIEATSLHD